MKKPLLISLSLLSVGLISGIYAQTTGATGSLVNKMKAAAQNFTLSTLLNPGETGLQSAPVKGKKTGDILTAGEWNRVLELMSEGGSGGSASGGSGAAAFVTYKNFSGTTTTIGKSEGIKSVANANGTPNFLAKDTLITFDEPLLTGDYAVIVSPSEDLSSILSVSRPTLDWVCMWNKISDSSLGVRCAYPGYGAYGNSIVSVAVIKGVGGGGSSNSAPAFYKCTNAQSLDATNAPCYGASRNGGAGTNKYRVVSCSNTDASGTYTAGGLLNFGDFMANKWSFHINNSNIACTDGSVLVMDIQGGGSGGSAGWEDVPLTDTADFDDSCMYRYQITYSAGGREPHVPKETYYYANGVSKTQLVWWLDNDSQLSTFHITASSKNIFRINGAPYNTVGGNPAVSIIKIEKLCGGGVGGSGSGWTNVSLTDTADFDTTCLYEAQFKTTDSTNNNLMNGDTSWRTGTIRGNKYLGFSFTDGSSATFSLWGIGSSNKNVYGYRDASGTFFPVNSVSVLSMRRLCGGGGGSSVNSDDYSRAKAIRASGFTLNIPSGITDWPDTIVCDGFGGWAGGRQILTLDFTGNNVVGYTQAEGVGVYFNPSTGVLAQADRVGSCGASNIATICAAGRCIK